MSFPWESIEGWSFCVQSGVNPFRNGIHPFFALCRGDHFGEEARCEELHTDDDGQKCKIEQRAVGHAIDMAEQARASQIHRDDESHEESDGTQHAEKVHRTVAEFRDEVDGHQIQIATDESAHAELGGAVFPLLMVYHLLPYMAESVHLGDDRNVTMHLAVDLYALHHLVAVSL